MMNIEEKTVLAKKELKEFLGIERLSLRFLIAQGLPYIKLDCKERIYFLFLKKSVVKWLESLEQPQVNPPQTDKVKLAKPVR